MPVDPETERAVSAALAEQALAEQEDIGVELGGVFTDMGKSIIKAVEAGLGNVKQGVVDVRDELKDVRESLGEKLDEVVGFVVDPIRKGLSAVTDELKSGLDPAMGAGLVVGAVVALRDKIREGLEWLWENWDVALEEGWDLVVSGLDKGWELLKSLAPHILEGLVKLGEFIITGAGKLWEFLETKVVPDIIDGVKALGKLIWDLTPDWLQSGLEAVGSVVAKIGSLAADVGSFVYSGLEKIFRAMGLDTLADVVDYLSDVLDAIGDWLGVGGEDRGARDAAARRRAATPEGIRAEGTERQKDIYAEVTAAGGAPTTAAGLATLAMPGREAEMEAAMAAFRGAVEAGASAGEARKIAMLAYNKAFREGRRGAAARPVVGAAGIGGIGGIVAERADEVATAKETNEALRKMVALTERADREKVREGDRQEVLDTVSSADELGVFPSGRMAGGIT